MPTLQEPSQPPARSRHALRLFAGLPSNYDRMGRLLSFGQDPRWRRFMVSRVRVRRGDRVLDVATGTGMVARELVERTGVKVVGLDQSEEMLRRGIAETDASGLAGSIEFLLGRGELLPFRDGTFDAVTFTYLLRYVEDPAGALRELARVLKEGGTLANLEFHVPQPAIYRAPWWLYTRVGLPAAGRLASREWLEVGRFLGPSISEFYRRHPLAEQLAMWRAAGVSDVRARVMSLGGGVVIWGGKPGGGAVGA